MKLMLIFGQESNIDPECIFFAPKTKGTTFISDISYIESNHDVHNIEVWTDRQIGIKINAHRGVCLNSNLDTYLHKITFLAQNYQTSILLLPICLLDTF